MPSLRRSRPVTILGAAVVALAFIGIALATLTPGGARSEPTVACIVCGERGVSDAIVNLLLFLPLGVGLALARTPLRTALLAGALIAGLIEVAQLAVIPGRDPSIGDLLFDAMGTAVGAGLVLAIPPLARLDDLTAARLSMAAALDVMLTVAVTGWLLQPSFPRTQYWAQWTPNLGHLEWYRGRVRSARLAGVDLRSGRRIANSAWARSALMKGELLEVHALAGPAVTGLASLVSVADEGQRVIVLLGPDRDALVYRFRTRTADFRLDQPDLRVDGGWPNLPLGDSLRVRLWSTARGEWNLAAGDQVHTGLGFTAGAGWGLLYYPEWFPGAVRRLLSAAWIALLVFPAGFCLRRRREGVAAVALIAVGLGLVPAGVALRPTSGLGWLGAGLGLVAGGFFARAVRSMTKPSTT